MDKKILYISYDGMTDNLGQSQVIPYLKGLSDKGYKITLLSFEKDINFLSKKDNISNILRKADIDWIPLKYTSSPPVLSTVKDIIHLLKKATELNKTHNYNIVHCRSYIAAFAGVKLQKSGVKFIFDMRGFWPDERVDGKIWNLKNPIFNIIYKYFKRKEKEFLLKADYTISLTQNGKNIINTRPFMRVKSDNIKVIPCCADFNHFSPSNEHLELSKRIMKNIGINTDDFILSYLGSVGTWYMLDEMLDFFNILIKKKENAKFLFITAEPSEMILSKANEKGIPAERFIIRQASRNEVPAYILLSTVSIFFIKPLFSKKASSPTKMAEIMGMGIPVICNSNVGDIDELIKKTAGGLLVNNFSTEEYIRTVKQIDKLLSIPPHKIRESALQEFSLDEGINRYDSVYKQLLN